jgi:chaperonin cofactor prefoldin
LAYKDLHTLKIASLEKKTKNLEERIDELERQLKTKN